MEWEILHIFNDGGDIQGTCKAAEGVVAFWHQQVVLLGTGKAAKGVVVVDQRRLAGSTAAAPFQRPLVERPGAGGTAAAP